MIIQQVVRKMGGVERIKEARMADIQHQHQQVMDAVLKRDNQLRGNQQRDFAAEAERARLRAKESERQLKQAREASASAKQDEVARAKRLLEEAKADWLRENDYKHGTSIAGKPLTFTRRVVSPREWARLSEWDKHGPDGRHWNGLTREWVHPDSSAKFAPDFAPDNEFQPTFRTP